MLYMLMWYYMFDLSSWTNIWSRKILRQVRPSHMLRIDEVVRATYAGRMDSLKSQKLAEIMLVVDSCFLLQLFLRLDDSSSSSSNSVRRPADLGNDWDPLSNNNWAPVRILIWTYYNHYINSPYLIIIVSHYFCLASCNWLGQIFGLMLEAFGPLSPMTHCCPIKQCLLLIYGYGAFLDEDQRYSLSPMTH